jgi:DNA processing protein
VGVKNTPGGRQRDFSTFDKGFEDFIIFDTPYNNVMKEKELLYNIAITLVPEIGDIRAKSLIAYCGSAEAVFRTRYDKLMKIPGIGSLAANAVAKANVMKQAEAEVEFVKKHKITPLFFADDNYPKRLRHCDDSPVLLYYKGNVDLNSTRVIAIVGTRKASDYGRKICEKLVNDLAALNVVVMSGLAYGIDICAHRASLENGLNTVGVLAHGLDRIYPSVHASTAKKMIRQGGLLTEFPSGTNPDRENFPKRNRIVAGMSDAVIVIEAGAKGGALITAELGNSYNRDVFAFPGRVGDPYSEGCNNLIKTNRAALIQSAKDIEYIMGWEEEHSKEKRNIQKQLFVDLGPDETVIVGVLKEKGKVNIDELSMLSKFPMSKTATVLLNLEFSGLVRSLPGKVYQLN